MSFCLRSVFVDIYVLYDIPAYGNVLVFVISILKYMHVHVWPNLVFKYLFFIHALGFLRELAEYIQDNHSSIVLIQMNSEEGN